MVTPLRARGFLSRRPPQSSPVEGEDKSWQFSWFEGVDSVMKDCPENKCGVICGGIVSVSPIADGSRAIVQDTGG